MNNLPKPGEVWGVEDIPTTWRLVTGVSDKHVHCETFGEDKEEPSLADEWCETGFVNITAIVAAVNTNAE